MPNDTARKTQEWVSDPPADPLPAKQELGVVLKCNWHYAYRSVALFVRVAFAMHFPCIFAIRSPTAGAFQNHSMAHLIAGYRRSPGCTCEPDGDLPRSPSDD